MNILYVSALEGGKYSGPLYSVPKQVQAQAKIDNVYWVNLTEISTVNRFDENLYHYIPLKRFRLSGLPEPFNKPDLIVFEEFFKIECCKVGRDAVKNKIPYIIIPRCQMTGKYLQNKKLKKMLASIIMFSDFAKKALSVQFLTPQEQVDSVEYFKGNYFIIPNGIDIPEQTVSFRNKTDYTGTFIGRYSIWQKGLDLLIKAIEKEKKVLEEHHLIFELYGPDERTGSSQDIIELVKENKVEHLVHVNGPVFDDEKKKKLLDSDFFIHTSRFEGMPMSVLEALSYGLPCVVTQGSNLKEDVELYNAGWGASDTVEDIANVLKNVAKNLDLLQVKGTYAVELAKKYSWGSIAKESHEYFMNALKK
ncbi:glycosyltransferase [Lacrimispora indolis]|uniref:glycosyltransferase n=1 Tax=Lacrimispora indolis TaxID=69825 RepID=UPI00045E7889|nr:glycosyltransferase [Lacrimispora indolis]